MCPLYVLLNKLLGADEQNDHEPEVGKLTLVESYKFTRSLRNEKSSGGIMSQSRFVEVPHIKQIRNWDCGLACVLMVMRTLGIKNYDLHELGELCHTTSIWTVDLAYLLQKLSISFSYFTVTIGANPDFSVETFYQEQLPNDIMRVDMLFRGSPEAGINIECRSVNEKEIALLILSGKYVAIALVDQYKLRPSWAEDVYISDLYSGYGGYTGHYVVICGYDALTDAFEIRDPASSRQRERITSRCLAEARKSFGTDEDILLISLENEGNVKSP